MVEHVKSVDTELSLETLAQPEVFIHARIPSVNAQASDCVAAQISRAQKDSSAIQRYVGGGSTGEVSADYAMAPSDSRRNRSGHVRAIARGPIGADIQRRAGAQGDDVVPLPAADNVVESRWNIAGILLAFAEGKLVERTEDEEVADILIRTSPVEVQ